LWERPDKLLGDLGGGGVLEEDLLAAAAID
jgi:hypothetical protein